MHVFVKVYAAFYPLDCPCPGLEDLVPFVIADEPWLFFEKDMLQISYEGIAFPVDDALETLAGFLPATAEGKMDVIDLEAWVLTRHIWQHGAFTSTERDLNHILDYSGH